MKCITDHVIFKVGNEIKRVPPTTVGQTCRGSILSSTSTHERDEILSWYFIPIHPFRVLSSPNRYFQFLVKITSHGLILCTRTLLVPRGETGHARATDLLHLDLLYARRSSTQGNLSTRNTEVFFLLSKYPSFRPGPPPSSDPLSQTTLDVGPAPRSNPRCDVTGLLGSFGGRRGRRDQVKSPRLNVSSCKFA